MAWQRWDTDRDVQKYLPEPANKAVSDGEQLAYFRECLAEENAAYWTIVFSEIGETIGTISLNDISRYHGVAEINMVIGEKRYWGKGLGTEAVAAVLSYAKDVMGLRRVVGEYETENGGVARVLAMNGFIEECRCRASRMKDGHPIDTVRTYILL